MAQDKTTKKTPQEKADKAKRASTPGEYPVDRNVTLKVSLNRGVIERAYYFRKKKRGKEYNPKMAPASTNINKVLLCRDAMSEAVDAGRCPIKARDAFFGQAMTARNKTFGELAIEYMEYQKANDKMAPKTWTNYYGTLKYHVLPHLKNRIAREITENDVLAVMHQTYTNKQGITGPANLTMSLSASKRLRQSMDKVLNFGNKQEGWEKLSVARWKGHMDDHLKVNVGSALHIPEKPMPALPYDLLPVFMETLRKIDKPGARLLMFTIMCGQRSTEVRLAIWDEFDLEQGIWRVCQKRMKKRLPHTVFLSASMIAFLKSLPRRNVKPGEPDYVFWGRNKGTPNGKCATFYIIRDMHNAKLERDGIGWVDRDGNRISTHGFRASMRTWAATVPDDKVRNAFELVNAAQARRGNQSASDAVYFRAADIPDLRKLWSVWNSYILPPKLRAVA